MLIHIIVAIISSVTCISPGHGWELAASEVLDGSVGGRLLDGGMPFGAVPVTTAVSEVGAMGGWYHTNALLITTRMGDSTLIPVMTIVVAIATYIPQGASGCGVSDVGEVALGALEGGWWWGICVGY